MFSKIAYAGDPAKGWQPWGVLVPFLGIVFVVLTVGSQQVLLEHMHLIDAQENPVGLVGFVAFLLGPFGALAAVTLAWVRFVERRSFATIGLAPVRPLLTLAQGHLVGDAMMACVVGGIWLTGSLTAGGYTPAFASLTSVASIALLLVGFVVQSGTEELLFRGWMLSAVAAKFGTPAGVVVSSLMFTLLHFDPSGTVLFFLNVFLFAVFACLWALRTGNIWGVMGWHAGWNWLLGVGFGLRVTGLDTHMPALLVKLTQSGPVYLTGGAQGAEGSIVCSVVLLGGIAFNAWRARTSGTVALSAA
jgi:membrane protease YdiL (CAAX protease family)